MNTKPEREWFDWKIDICKKIYDINETEAKIVLCCIISRFAVGLWPRKDKKDRIDEKRFIQTLIDFTPIKFDINKISIPMLELNLKEDGEDVLAEKVVKEFDSDRLRHEVLSGSQIDKDENEIIKKIPDIPVKVLRKASYAGIIYSQVRCYLAHQYKTSEKMDNYNMSGYEDEPSYVNLSRHINERGEESFVNKRLMYLPYKYFLAMVIETVNEIFKYWESSIVYEKPYPNPWWIEGK